MMIRPLVRPLEESHRMTRQMREVARKRILWIVVSPGSTMCGRLCGGCLCSLIEWFSFLLIIKSFMGNDVWALFYFKNFLWELFQKCHNSFFENKKRFLNIWVTLFCCGCEKVGFHNLGEEKLKKSIEICSAIELVQNVVIITFCEISKKNIWGSGRWNW